MRNISFISLLALAACADSPATAAAATAKFNVRDFDRVALQGPDSIHILPGNDFSAVAEGPQEALDQLDLHVDQGTLKVGRKHDKGSSWTGARGTGRVRITLTMPVIHGAALSGAGDLDVGALASGEVFSASLSGAGDLTVRNAKVQRLELHLSGAGNMILAGTTDKLVAGVSGSGNVDAKGLAARTAQLNISGVGNIDARVSESAAGGVSGVGNVAVSGGAQCTFQKSGVGAVSCAP